MRQTDAIIIGAGQAGLAMSHCLGRLGIDHVVLERGRLAERWRSERWDSLRLLTPNWMSRLPGWSYHGADPDGFMTKQEFVAYLEQYASAASAPVVTGAAVRSVRHVPGGYRVESDRGVWHAPCVVIATGHCDVPLVPEMARHLPGVDPPGDAVRLPQSRRTAGGRRAGRRRLRVRRAARRGNPAVRPAGHHLGRRHTRLPRRYRGRDIMWWLDRPGIVGQNAEAITDLAAARSQPSMQLVGRPDGRTSTLGRCATSASGWSGALSASGMVSLHLDDDLAETVAAAQARLERLLARIDASADAVGAPPRPGRPGLRSTHRRPPSTLRPTASGRSSGPRFQAQLSLAARAGARRGG